MMNKSATFDSHLEERLLSANLVNSDQLALIRELQQESPLPLARALVELDLLSAREVDRIVDSIHEVRFIKLEDLQIDREAIRHVPARIARHQRCIPVRRNGSMLVIAAANPLDPALRDALSGATDCELLILAAEPDAIEHALYLYYSIDDQSSERSVNEGSRGKGEYALDPWVIPLPWSMSFDTFLDHDGSRRARELAKQIASGSAEPIDLPLILIGNTGSGKTHLMMAIKNYYALHDPLKRGVYCTGLEFEAKYWDYRIAGQSNYFRYELRDRNCILVDDCASAFGSEDVELELTSLIEHCIQNGACIVLSMNPDHRITGPVTPELRRALDDGTDVELAGMNHDTLLSLIERRVDGIQVTDMTKLCNGPSELKSWTAMRDCLKSCAQGHE